MIYMSIYACATQEGIYEMLDQDKRCGSEYNLAHPIYKEEWS